MGLVSLSMPLMNSDIRQLWFSLPNFLFLQPMPILSLLFFVMLWRDLRSEREFRPFFLTLGIFLMNYIGIGVSTWPWLVPFQVTLWDAAATPESQSLLLLGTLFLLPCILTYTGYCFWVFRGKASHEHDAAY
jgi:cytochrome d ubiquinol oxidase subunit II